MKILLALITLTSIQSWAAICSCDAPPSCGVRPGSCFRSEARDFAGKVFVEKTNSVPTILAFSNEVSSSASVKVAWGRVNDGMPFGYYYVYFTSENTFKLMLAPADGRAHSVMEEFEFILQHFPTEIKSLRTQNGREFLQKR